MQNRQLISFDPSETIRGIQQLLVSEKKKIAFLFGDGTQSANRTSGMPFVPPMSEIIASIEKEISKNSKYAAVFAVIKKELSHTPHGFTIETLLSDIEDKIRMIGSQTLDNLNRGDYAKLRELIRDMLCEAVSVHKKISNEDAKRLVHYDFAKWIKNADKKQAIEIFTTNYDFLFEIGFEEMEVPYYDGFSGSYRPFFNPVSLTDMGYLRSQTKIWKMNGSLGLYEIMTGSTNPKIIRSGADASGDAQLLMYSSAQKYSNSKSSPYAAYLDRLYYFVKQDEAVLFVCGYTFNNEHINERILSALNISSTSHVFVFYSDKNNELNPDDELAKIALNNRRITVLGPRNAIIGCVYGSWKLKREPDSQDSHGISSYFDYKTKGYSQAVDNSRLWTGEGELVLYDFARFVDFLRNTIPRNEWEG